ncbi:hypothetical protein E0504_10390 [Parafrankia sp. BMG5.11]|nr:hypothetical protein E0504_10390 [Parafrankia sp. BMG5.11]
MSICASDKSNHLVRLEDSKKQRSLKRHLMTEQGRPRLCHGYSLRADLI